MLKKGANCYFGLTAGISIRRGHYRYETSSNARNGMDGGPDHWIFFGRIIYVGEVI